MAGSNRTSVVLQERDRRLLEALESMRVINREQAKVVAGFRSTRRANDRLLILARAGFLKRAFIGSRQAVYWLPGKTLQERGRKSDGVSSEPAALFLNHQLEINRVHLLVQYAAIPVRGWWFVRWQDFQRPPSATVPLIPDGYFEVGSQQGFRPVFVEVDLGTEAVPVLARKASLYLQLATSGEFSQLFGRSQFRVLLITTSDRRLQNIRGAVAKLTDKIFWFGTLDAVSPERFWAASWLRPTGDQRQSLL
ncbi:MAG: replication-relaxation family protein [Planctomycetes bacterium]|nr:replication-relaxation family protein [Planctomycetota bacterium]